MLIDDISSSVEPRLLGGSRTLRPGPLNRLLARARRPLDRAYERRAAAVERMAGLSGPADPTRTHPRILVASLRGWAAHNAYELVIAQALRLRGARVALLTCGGGLPACELGWGRVAQPRPCDRCGWLTDRVLAAAGIESYRLAELLPWGGDPRSAPLDASAAATADARMSASWLLRAAQLHRVAGAGELARDFAAANDGVARAAAAVFDEFDPDVVLLLNGLFAAERTIRRLALERGVRAPTYEIAPRGGALVFAQDSAAPDFELGRLWASVRDRQLTADQREQVMGLLGDRARGVGAHESYFERVEESPSELRRRLALGERDRIVSLFTNVTWDSATLGHDIGFASMFDWIECSVRAASAREQVLVIRAHPGERRWGSREQVLEVIRSRLGELPANVRLIGAEDPISSYALLELSELLLTYTTTVGLEAAARGKHVAVAGDTHYRGRGFTTDVSDSRDLVDALAQPPRGLSAAETDIALRYAHMFFFRAMIPFPAVGAQGGKVVRLPDRRAELAPGADPYLDWVCERILDGDAFDLPDELACPVPGGVRSGGGTAR